MGDGGGDAIGIVRHLNNPAVPFAQWFGDGNLAMTKGRGPDDFTAIAVGDALNSDADANRRALCQGVVIGNELINQVTQGCDK